MPRIEIDLNPVTHITADAIGQPGKRVFYIQGQKDDQVVTLIVEKVQIQTLALGLEDFLSELSQRFPDLPEASADYDEVLMHIMPPVDPLFRVGELALGYDSESDTAILIAREITNQDEEDEQAEDEAREPGIGRRTGHQRSALLVHAGAAARDVPLGPGGSFAGAADLPVLRSADGPRRSLLPQAQWA